MATLLYDGEPIELSDPRAAGYANAGMVCRKWAGLDPLTGEPPGDRIELAQRSGDMDRVKGAFLARLMAEQHGR